MRRFSSYGPVNPKTHYYAPRKDLIEATCNRLFVEESGETGHFITVWAPRQCGKTWLMQQVLGKLRMDDRFDVVKINLESLKDKTNTSEIIKGVAAYIGKSLDLSIRDIDTQEKFQSIFEKGILSKPLILILDEFDALAEAAINSIVSAFRNIYISRSDAVGKPADQKPYLLHGLALVGVRSVLGIENVKGSPFNVQRSVHIPNLSFDEVKTMYRWYEKESGQKVEDAVIQRLFYETQGQPGLTCWFGELLSEGFEGHKIDTSRPIGMTDFEDVYAAATDILPNNNILNIISKAREKGNKEMVLQLFQTDEKLRFRFDQPVINALYMNGIISNEKGGDNRYYMRFASPFVQKRLFNYFSGEMFQEMGQLVEPFGQPGQSLDDVMTPEHLDIPVLMKLYQDYLTRNGHWLFKEVPRRADLRVYEAVFHFNLYSFLDRLLRSDKNQVLPEFPTGNGKVDLLVRYNDHSYAIELKSFTHRAAYREAIAQAARYGKQLNLKDIYLVTFVETIDDSTRQDYETPTTDPDTGVTIYPLFIQTGRP